MALKVDYGNNRDTARGDRLRANTPRTSTARTPGVESLEGRALKGVQAIRPPGELSAEIASHNGLNEALRNLEKAFRFAKQRIIAQIAHPPEVPVVEGIAAGGPPPLMPPTDVISGNLPPSPSNPISIEPNTPGTARMTPPSTPVGSSAEGISAELAEGMAKTGQFAEISSTGSKIIKGTGAFLKKASTPLLIATAVGEGGAGGIGGITAAYNAQGQRKDPVNVGQAKGVGGALGGVLSLLDVVGLPIKTDEKTGKRVPDYDNPFSKRAGNAVTRLLTKAETAPGVQEQRNLKKFMAQAQGEILLPDAKKLTDMNAEQLEELRIKLDGKVMPKLNEKLSEAQDNQSKSWPGPFGSKAQYTQQAGEMLAAQTELKAYTNQVIALRNEKAKSEKMAVQELGKRESGNVTDKAIPDNKSVDRSQPVQPSATTASNRPKAAATGLM